MALAEVYSSVLPIIDVDKQVKQKDIVPISPANITYYTIPAVGTTTGTQANSSLVFNIIPPLADAVMSRLIRIRLQFQVQVNGAYANNVNPPPNVFNSAYCGFASFPINSIFSTLTLDINNSSTTIRPSQVIKDLLRYDDPKKLIYGTLSQSPCLMDSTMEYAQITNFIQSPFGSFADDMLSRNAYDINFISNPAITAAGNAGAQNGTLQAAFIEPLIIPPLVYTEDWFNYPGFGGVTQATINITVDQTALNRVFRQARNDLVTWPNGPTVTIIGTPEIIVGFYTLNPIQKIPPVLSYKYSNIVNYTSSPVPLPAVGQSFQIQSQAIQLKAIPRAVLISVTKSTKTWQDADSYFPFGTLAVGGAVNSQNVISITFNNEVGILSTASMHDLYLLARKNGLEMPYSQFCGRQISFYNLFSVLQNNAIQQVYYTNSTANPQYIFMNGSGGPLLLLFGVDIPIGAEDYVGKNGYYTFQISVNCWNNLYNGGTVNIPATQAQLNLIFIYDGWMRIQNGTVTFDVGLPPTLTPAGLPQTQYPKINWLMRGAGLQAGSLFGSIGKVLSGIPIVGPLLGNLFPNDEEERQQTPQLPPPPSITPQQVAAEAAAAAKEAVQEALQSLKTTRTTTKPATKGGSALWKKYIV